MLLSPRIKITIYEHYLVLVCHAPMELEVCTNLAVNATLKMVGGSRQMRVSPVDRA